MMRERSWANLTSPEKASQRYRLPVSGYLPQNSNPSRLGEGTRDSSKLLICQLLIILCQSKALTLCVGNNSLGCSTPLAGMHPPRYPCSDKWGLHALAEQPGESVLCLKLRYWIEFSGILFQRQSIEFPRSIGTMKVAFETRGTVDEPYLKLNEEQILGMT